MPLRRHAPRHASVMMLAALAAAMTLPACSGSARGPELVPALPTEGADTADPDALSGGDTPADPWADRDDLIAAPAPPPPRALDLPPIERFTLRNGLSVIVVQSPGTPVVHMQLAVKAGTADSPRDKMGLAQFAAQMLTRGTRTRSATAIAETIEEVGGSLEATAGYDVTLVSCSAMARDRGTCQTLLADVTIHPTFPAKEMDEVARQLVATVRQRHDDAGKLAGAHLQNLLWGEDHVRGWPMSVRTIGAVTRPDLQAWHRSWFVPGNAVLAVAGDVDPRALRPELERLFSAWRRGKTPTRKTFDEPAAADARIRLVDKPGQTQSHIRIGLPGVAYADPTYLDHEVFNHVLGGGVFSSRLMRVARAQAGKVYGASSMFERSRDRGSFVMSTFTRNAEAAATAQLLFNELERMAREGPTEAELRDAITHLAGAHAIRFQSAAEVASALLATEIYGLKPDHVQRYPLEIAKVTQASAHQAAARALTPSRVAVVIVGDAREVAPQLDQLGWPYEVLGHVVPIASYERGPAALGEVDPKAEARARAILDRALRAKGGHARLGKLKSMTLRASGKLVADEHELAATFTRRYQAPDRLRMDIDIDLGGARAQIVTVLAGERGWNKQPGQGVALLRKEQVQELRNQIWLDQELILLRHRDKGTRVESLGEQTLAGRAFHLVRIRQAGDRVWAVLFIDKKTHLLGGMTYVENGVETIERFDDYRRVDGIQVAHRRLTRSEDTLLEVEVSSVTIDDSIDPALFSEPK